MPEDPFMRGIIDQQVFYILCYFYCYMLLYKRFTGGIGRSEIGTYYSMHEIRATACASKKAILFRR